VAVVSLCVLVLQLTLTRLFSATMYYHFAFLAVSLALLGGGASGVLVYLFQRGLGRWPVARLLSVCALLFAATTVGALLVVLANPLSPVEPGRTTMARLVRIYAAVAVPFLCGGAAVSLAVARFAAHMPRLYLFDLAGAALGCVLLIPLLDGVGAVNALLVVAAAAALAAAFFEAASPRSLPWRATVGLMGLALGGLLFHNLGAGTLDVRRAKGLDEAGHVIFARWNSFSRVTVWGSLAADRVLLMIDADAASEVVRDGRDLRRHAYLATRVEALPFLLRPRGRVLVLGAGGGNEVIMARLFGAREVTAVEVNPLIAEEVLGREPFRSFAGALYEQPGVRLVVDEARSFLRASGERWDVIQATMVDTWAATAAGAFSLTENNLYTAEAFADYAAHLADDGLLSMTRWYIEPPDQLLRLVALARVTAARSGAGPAAGRVMLVRGPTEAGSTRAPATFLFKKTPFTDAEVQVVERAAARLGHGVLYSPRTRPPNLFTQMLEAPDPAAVWLRLPQDVSPPRDNSPFFFNSVRLRDLAGVLGADEERRKTNLGTLVLAALLALSAGGTALFILGPLAVAGRREMAAASGPALRWLLVFACLGAGYIVVEVALAQKCILFLGAPVYALAVVLFTLLVFSGLGSRLSARFGPELERPLRRALGAVALLAVAVSLLLSPLFYALVHLPRPARIAVTVAVLAPLGLAMGLPLPTAVRVLARESPSLVPWAWGVNGAASVLGSVAALVIALFAGFNEALLAAAALYAAAQILVRGRAAPAHPPPAR
jgi:hypothetical protein